MTLETEIQKIRTTETRQAVLSVYYASEEMEDNEAIRAQIAKAVQELLAGDFMSADARLSLVAHEINNSNP